ncbi:DUF7563 family protein [Natrarchaeobaculum sulfurireducens]
MGALEVCQDVHLPACRAHVTNQFARVFGDGCDRANFCGEGDTCTRLSCGLPPGSRSRSPT